ncbi:phosphodiester glycosidase family protein [Alkaliphilus pronyensis]|uniref:Phosphodiester glycosidase family protein n=1 Tax=Alkaliphilus pronyensis TaxID=1482732 RepID=A0A6I0F8G4_9FIRM|nr:phosphodiester glycosidase family protein [Alkaliphilus pronyensis]KAB3534179.1 phosphodiester glycosidase family protein [Alkaliphilus pronyensis]
MNKRTNKGLKRIALFFMLIVLLSTSVYGNEATIDKIESDRLAPGVIHQNILRFSKDGWLNANVLYVDLTDKTTELKILKSENGLSTKETLSSMVKKEDKVIGAINGDFFFMNTPVASPTGTIVEKGEIISSPVINEELASFYINDNGQAFADYWDYELYITTDKGKKIEIGSINKYRWMYQEIMLIDGNWGKKSVGATEDLKDMVEVVVVDDVVTEVRKGKEAIDIPRNGYIILSAGPKAEELKKIEVGTIIQLHTDIKPNIERIELAMGGGTILVKDGKVADFTQNVSGNNPRTAIGITKNRQQLILLTVDGRHASFKGVDGKQLAKLLIELGSHEAIIMDGGGSTTMTKRNLGEHSSSVINYPSDGSERRIVNGLAVVSKTATGAVHGLIAEAENYNVIKGGSRGITLKAYDMYFNPININYDNVKYWIKSGAGTVENNRFLSQEAGETVVTVEYQGVTTDIAFEVLDNLSHIEMNPRTLQINNNSSANFFITGVTDLGYRVPIFAGDVIFKDLYSLGSFKGGKYTSNTASGETVIEAAFRDKTTNAIVAIGSDKKILDNFEAIRGTFTKYPDDVKGAIKLDNNPYTGKHSLRLEYDFSKTDATRAAYIEYGNGGIKAEGKPSKIGVWVHSNDNAPHWIRARLVDDNGEQHVIDLAKGINWTGWQYIEAAIPTKIKYPVAIDRLYVVKTDPKEKQTGSLLFDDLQALYQLPLTMTDKLINNPQIIDKANGPAETEGTKLFVHSGINFNKETLLDRMVSNRVINKINSKAQYALFTNTVNKAVSEEITAPYLEAKEGYRAEEFENNLFIQMNNSKRGFRATDFQQWPWLINKLNTTEKENIFIVLPSPVWGDNGFSDQLELKLFTETLTKEAEKGKNIYVLYGGTKAQVKIQDGVRYISTGKYNNDTNISPSENYKYIEFNIDGNNVTYELKPLFE